MRKRLAVSVMSVVAAVVLLPVSPAGATSCAIIEDPGVDDVYCVLYGTPGVREVCAKLPGC
ncbi:MAG: hypothetical protein M3217_06805 [Actinomycetota bacterium]|nr:hypothetical protein [Actinomycetota bacterium]